MPADRDPAEPLTPAAAARVLRALKTGSRLKADPELNIGEAEAERFRRVCQAMSQCLPVYKQLSQADIDKAAHMLKVNWPTCGPTIAAVMCRVRRAIRGSVFPEPDATKEGE